MLTAAWMIAKTWATRIASLAWGLLQALARIMAEGFAAPVLGPLCALLLLVLVGGLGWQTMQLDGLRAWVKQDQAAQAAAVAKARADTARRAALAVKISDQVGARVEARQAEVRTVTRTLIKEVPTYVTVQADRTVAVPVGFVWLHDAAARGQPLAAVPPGPPGAADAPSGLALSAVAATVVDNYGTCHVLREQVLGWQSWYAEQKAAWEAKAPQPPS